MSVSLFFGHIGRFNTETGLHVLAGSAQDVTIDHRHLQQTAEGRSGYEINSNVPFTAPDPSKKDCFKFLNQTECYSTTPGDFSVDLEILAGKTKGVEDTIVERMMNAKNAAFRMLNTERWADKIYSNRVIGLVPPSVFLKMVLKQKGSKSKRVVMFACGISEKLGGRTWVVTPQGFTWLEGRHLVAKGRGGDMSHILDRGHSGAPGSWLYGGITNAVPFISGPSFRKPDEDHPKVISFTLDSQDYNVLLTNTLKKMHDIHDSHALVPALHMVREAMFAAEKSGKVKTLVRDLVDAGMIALGDDDSDGMW